MMKGEAMRSYRLAALGACTALFSSIVAPVSASVAGPDPLPQAHLVERLKTFAIGAGGSSMTAATALDVASAVLESRRVGDAVSESIQGAGDASAISLARADAIVSMDAGPVSAQIRDIHDVIADGGHDDSGAIRSQDQPQQPSEAAAKLLETLGAPEPTATDSSLRHLDELTEAQRSGLSSLFVAFADFHVAAEAVFSDQASANAASLGVDGLQGDRPSTALWDLGPLNAARSELLAASSGVSEAFEGVAVPASASPLVYLPPYLAVDPQGVASTYSEYLLLSVDAGGDDTYLNNAGGNSGFLCGTGVTNHAAALVDAGGNDSYSGNRSCGANGGGVTGAGFLFDATGDDYYQAGERGVNGGATEGTGFLADVEGEDTYVGTTIGVNGGTYSGEGLLIDGGGDDSYSGTSGGVNGGGVLGRGGLVDLSGFDRYVGAGRGVNGGGFIAGSGMLLDLESGLDTYQATDSGVNGGGGNEATLGELVGGSGLLFDGGGTDVYTGGSKGANGGGSLGVGMLVDTSGDDRFEAGGVGTNGGGNFGGIGIIVDAWGNDTRTAVDGGVNGGASFLASGTLADFGGNDAYNAGNGGVNGGGGVGTGLLFDSTGADSYSSPAGVTAVNGAGAAGVGALLDYGGLDSYLDAAGGSGTDRTVSPKGTYGFQVDDPALTGVGTPSPEEVDEAMPVAPPALPDEALLDLSGTGAEIPTEGGTTSASSGTVTSPAGCWGKHNHPHPSTSSPGYAKAYAFTSCNSFVGLWIRVKIWRHRWWGWQERNSKNWGYGSATGISLGATTPCTGTYTYRGTSRHESYESSSTYYANLESRHRRIRSIDSGRDCMYVD